MSKINNKNPTNKNPTNKNTTNEKVVNNTNKKNKQKLGQFYTTNHAYILQNMIIPNNIENIIEPFAGEGHLIDFIKCNTIVSYNIECYDIEPKKDFIIERDTITNPPDYNNKYIITNPPYLARNKSSNKNLFDKYDTNDLYKCVIKEIITNTCLGGIFIIPLNFWCSIRINDINLRKLFLDKYKILLLNIFEERVFSDTSYTICSFQFELKELNSLNENNKIDIIIYPSKICITTDLNDNNNYMIGGDIYKLKVNNLYKISRLTNKNKDTLNYTNILVKCIDDNENNKIGLSFIENDEDIYIDDTLNQSARTYATLVIEPPINKIIQQQLIFKFNVYLNNYRKKYNSLFLTNYRESKDISRKRISFDLIYLITQYVLEHIDDVYENDNDSC